MRLPTQIDALLAELLERAGSPRADSVARKIILGLPTHPFVSADSAAALYGVTPTAARAALNRLEAAGVLLPPESGAAATASGSATSSSSSSTVSSTQSAKQVTAANNARLRPPRRHHERIDDPIPGYLAVR